MKKSVQPLKCCYMNLISETQSVEEYLDYITLFYSPQTPQPNVVLEFRLDCRNFSRYPENSKLREKLKIQLI